MQTYFLVDGFNLYHSLRETSQRTGDESVKWLDIKALCETTLPNVHAKAALGGIYYYSAYVRRQNRWSNLKASRQRRYIDALAATGVEVKMHRFKDQLRDCPSCRQEVPFQQEKQTDVAIASKLFALLNRREADAVAIISGDTDYIPALQTAKLLYPGAHLAVVFPAHRRNSEVAQVVDCTSTWSLDAYRKHRFPFAVPTGNGKSVECPPEWR